MRGGTILNIFFIIAIFTSVIIINDINTTGAVTSCTPVWSCSDWSSCVNGEKVRICVDINLCGVSTEKPEERMECGTTCTPNWECSDWTPKDCTETEIQTRNCIDNNNCDSQAGMPEGIRNCEITESYEWLFYVIIAINILTIFTLLVLIIMLIQKQNRQNKKREKIQQLNKNHQKPYSAPTNQYSQISKTQETTTIQ